MIPFSLFFSAYLGTFSAYLGTFSAYLGTWIFESLILRGVQGENFPIKSYKRLIGNNRLHFVPVYAKVKGG